MPPWSQPAGKWGVAARGEVGRRVRRVALEEAPRRRDDEDPGAPCAAEHERGGTASRTNAVRYFVFVFVLVCRPRLRARARARARFSNPSASASAKTRDDRRETTDGRRARTGYRLPERCTGAPVGTLSASLTT